MVTIQIVDSSISTNDVHVTLPLLFLPATEKRGQHASNNSRSTLNARFATSHRDGGVYRGILKSW